LRLDGASAKWNFHNTSQQARGGQHVWSTDATNIASQIGRRALEDLVAAHRLWIEWLASGSMSCVAMLPSKTFTG